MSQTSIQQLDEFGQSIWLDYISCEIMATGRLKKMIDQGLRGMTTNPTIFDKAISQTNNYDECIRKSSEGGGTTFELYDNLTVRDVQSAADIFRPIYEKTNGLDGYVSLEINPELAMKIEDTIAEGIRLHKKVNRPNVLFKVPATEAGFPAFEELIAEEINVNITLIFSPEQYEKTAKTYLKGIRRLLQKGGDASKVASVASVFVSRIDAAVDMLINDRIKNEQAEAITFRLQALQGKAGAANSGIIFKKYSDIFSGNEFLNLKEKGAKVQRLLWGSTGTKNPAYSDIKYVTELIGKNTVNTVPENTFNAFLDHGAAQEALTSDTSGAGSILRNLAELDIDLETVFAVLLKNGVASFEKSFRSLLHSIEEKVNLLKPAP